MQTVYLHFKPYVSVVCLPQFQLCPSQRRPGGCDVGGALGQSHSCAPEGGGTIRTHHIVMDSSGL